jgi:hypothetical protein
MTPTTYTRPSTQKKIDALHAEITELVEAEKQFFTLKHPELNSFQLSICLCSIEVDGWSPSHKERLGVATTPSLY